MRLSLAYTRLHAGMQACRHAGMHTYMWRFTRRDTMPAPLTDVRTIDVHTTIAVQQVVGNPCVTTLSTALSVTAARRACGPSCACARSDSDVGWGIGTPDEFQSRGAARAPTPTRQSQTTQCLSI